jgi:hypothetical protein
MKIIIYLFLILLSHCANSLVPAWHAQSQINAAVDYKAKECKTPPPQPPLYVFTDQVPRNLDFCTIAITRTNCPFDGYPIACLGIYYTQATPKELPWYFNFNELAKKKFNP